MREPVSSDYRHDIDGLRAIAVLLVIVHHVAPQLLPGGFIGVDVFFVISGYLMTGILDRSMRDGSYRFVEFVWKRCRRIVPALVTVLAATLVVGACIMTGPEYVNLGRHLVAGSLSASNLLLWSEVGYFDTSAAVKPLLHLWSLGVEEQFYLIWPLLLSVLPLARRVRLLAILAIVALSLLVSEDLAYAEPSQAFYMLHSRAWELGVGALVALAMPISTTSDTEVLDRQRLLRGIAAVLGVGLIVHAAWRTTAADAWPGLTAIAPVLGTALVIAAGPRTLVSRHLLSGQSQTWLGQRSYSLYLWHWPPLAFLHILAAEHSWSGNVVQWAAVLLMVPVFVLAHATLIFVERPARHRAARVQSRVTISARHLRPYGFALAAVAATAMAVVQGRGLPARYGGAGTDVAAAMRDASPDSITAYGAHASRCHLADKGNATWCWRTPGIGKGIAVFGDSHAEVIFAGIDAWHSTAPLFLTGRKGCAPILQQEAIADREAEICRRAANLAANAILADTSIGTVLLVSRGPAYITGTGFGVDSQRRVVPVALQRSPAIRRASGGPTSPGWNAAFRHSAGPASACCS